MPSFEKLKKLYGTSTGDAKSLGQIRKEQSDMIMETTWDGDLQSRTAYLYDFFHDSEPDLMHGLHSSTDPLKTAVKIKFIVHSHNSDGKDQVSYHIQFQPSYECNVDYYEQHFHKRYGAEFPLGLYIDIPDGKGVFRRWLIVEDGSRFDLSFDKYCVYPINYHLRWVEDDGKQRVLRSMWGVERMRNSYNAGIYSDRVFTRVENQTVIWLPMNSISEKIFYDQRFIVSAPVACPLTWSVSKVENTLPFGINRLVLYQDAFDRDVDYVNLETGEMYANYYSSSIVPQEPDQVPVEGPYGQIKVSTKNIRVGGGYKTIRVLWFNADGTEIKDIRVGAEQWRFQIDGSAADPSLVDVKAATDSNGAPIANAIKLRFMGGYEYLTKLLNVAVETPDKTINASFELEILSL